TVPYAFSVATVDSAAGGQITSGVGIGVASGPYRLHVNSSDSVVSRITGDFDGPSGAIFKAEYLGPTSSDYDAYAVRGLALQNTSSEYGVGGRFEGGYNGVVGVGYSAGVIGTGADANGSCMGVSGSTVSTNIGDAYGVRGTASVTGDANGYGVYGIVTGTTTGVRYAGYFAGNVHVNGTLSKAAGSFKIDHPLDPANKYLYHSFVESPDMMNVYNGNVVLDGAGEATVSLPDYFEVLNRDFRYQLTAIGAPAPNLHVAEKINGGRFRIAGGAPGMEVSWMVTGIRQDAFANAHRIPVEENKGAEERGRYLYPEALGKTAAEGIDSARERAVDQRGDQAED
ncbi:MAG TPA: hypothetical protein PKW75_12745, partial [candidate division Zixibacteria bacterium]|nr:hypothetical protein [candidate division Zixibacteria bacterium]